MRDEHKLHFKPGVSFISKFVMFFFLVRRFRALHHLMVTIFSVNVDHVSTNFCYILDVKCKECMHYFVDCIAEKIQMNELDQLISVLCLWISLFGGLYFFSVTLSILIILLMFVWPCIIEINNVEDQLDATVAIYWYTNRLNMFRAIFCPSSGAQDCVLQHVV